MTPSKSCIQSAWVVSQPLLNRLIEFPRSVSWMRRLAGALAANQKPRDRGSILFAPAAVLRNLLFLAIVLTHGLRRLLPPY